MNREEDLDTQAVQAEKSWIEFCGYTLKNGDVESIFKKGAEWADAHPKNPWISVKDKLPEENRKVFFILLFRGIHKEYLAGLYREHKWETERRTYLSPSFDGIVTHWMPIPELNAEPKE